MSTLGHPHSWFQETGLGDHHCSLQRKNKSLTTKGQHHAQLLANVTAGEH